MLRKNRDVKDSFKVIKTDICVHRIKPEEMRMLNSGDQSRLFLMNIGFALKKKLSFHAENEFQHRLLTDRMNIHTMQWECIGEHLIRWGKAILEQGINYE